MDLGRMVFFTVHTPHEVPRATRRAGVIEYRATVAPAVDLHVRLRYNAARGSALPKLAVYGFRILCTPDRLDEQVALIEAEALPLLERMAKTEA